MNKDSNNDPKIFFGKFRQEKKIGEGSFGKIYTAVNITTNEKYALKLESKSGQNLLESEAYVLCYLKGTGIPIVKSYGISGENNVLVMELLHKSLEDLFQENGGKLSLKTTCYLGIQMIDRIEYVHNKHIIHRDIKPDNFVMGLSDNSKMVYIIDFGLAKKYRSSKTLQHIPYKSNKKLTGTARYASINALRGGEQSRRDDLEAIGYVLMYFLRGALPWQGLKIDKKEDRYKKIFEKKKNTTPEELCNGYPQEFCQYVVYTRNLQFEDMPDYEMLRNLLRKVLDDNFGSHDEIEFDWEKKKEEPKRKSVKHPSGKLNEPVKKSQNLKENENMERIRLNLSTTKNGLRQSEMTIKKESIQPNLQLPSIIQGKRQKDKKNVSDLNTTKNLMNSSYSHNNDLDYQNKSKIVNTSINGGLEGKFNNSQIIESKMNNLNHSVDKNLTRNGFNTNNTQMNYNKANDILITKDPKLDTLNGIINNKIRVSEKIDNLKFKGDSRFNEKNRILTSNNNDTVKNEKQDNKCCII